MTEAVNVFGLGKIGSILSVLLAKSGFEVNGFDPNPSYCKDIFGGMASPEPGFDGLLPFTKNVSINPEKSVAIKSAKTSLVIVPTPSEPNGAYSLTYVISAVEEILGHLEKDSDHAIVVKSTVLPGDIAKLEDFANSKGYTKIGFAYNPEFIALGDVIRNMTNPDLVLIGARSEQISSHLLQINSQIFTNNPRLAILNTEEAELAKVALNSYVTMKITFANLVGRAAEALGSPNPGRVLEAIGSDSRIGNKYLRPGLGFGGPCFPRDNQALSIALDGLGIESSLLKSVDIFNKSIPNTFLEKITSALDASGSTNPRVLIVGAAYKLGSPETVESQPLNIAKELIGSRPEATVEIYDPVVSRFMHPDSRNFTFVEARQMDQYDLVFVGLPYLDASEINSLLKPHGHVINPWGG
jgi:UDPglucose 6-dehydrogenase